MIKYLFQTETHFDEDLLRNLAANIEIAFRLRIALHIELQNSQWKKDSQINSEKFS